MKRSINLVLFFGAFFFLGSVDVLAEEPKRRFRFEFEAGPSWQSRNDVQIPGDTGTPFSLSDFSSGPFFSYRMYLSYRFNKRHSLRALFAPFEVGVSGTSSSDINFNDTVFLGDEELNGTYKFNSYRLAYLYSFASETPWKFHVGFSAKIRDARISLSNSTTQETYSNIGFVPLLVGRAEYHFQNKFIALFDVEGLGSPQGRAVDATLQLRYQYSEGLDAGIGYRTVEGGADNDKVNAFAWVHYIVFSLGVEF